MIRFLVCIAATLLLISPVVPDDAKKPTSTATGNKSDTAETSMPANAERSAKQGARRGRFQNDANAVHGRITKAGLENDVLKLTLDGKEYEFAIGDHTRAMLRTTEKDGKQVVGVMLSNGEGRRAASRTRPAKKGRDQKTRSAN